MNKKLISSILVVALLHLVGCYSFQSVTAPEYKLVEKEEGKTDEIFVKTKGLLEYHFTDSNFYIENDTLYGKGKLLLSSGEELLDIKIALSNIEVIEVESFNLSNTILLTGGIVIILASAFFILYAIAATKMAR